MMVASEAMPQGPEADIGSQCNHRPFEERIVDDIHPQDGKAAQEDGQQGAMNGAGYGGGNAQSVVIDPDHGRYKGT